MSAKASSAPCVLVTGASRGLGRGIAVALAAAGHRVAIHCAGRRDAAGETAALCREAAAASGHDHQGDAFPVVGGDLGRPDERDRVFGDALAALGHLDALVNNAGITSPGRLDIVEATEENFDHVLGINLKAPFFLAQSAARYWLDHPGEARLDGGYKAVFVSSISAFAISTNRGDYCISKAALAMVNQLWAARLAEHGVQTLEVLPGIMLTDMTAPVKEKYDTLIAGGLVPQRRWGTPEDAGRAVRAFLSGDLPFVTGDQLHLDGGFHLRRL